MYCKYKIQHSIITDQNNKICLKHKLSLALKYKYKGHKTFMSFFRNNLPKYQRNDLNNKMYEISEFKHNYQTRATARKLLNNNFHKIGLKFFFYNICMKHFLVSEKFLEGTLPQ